MLVETKKDKLFLNQLINKKSETIIVEGDVIVPDIKPDVLNTIYSKGTVCIYKKEILEGKIKIDGGIHLYIIYLAESNDSIRSLNTVLDFNQIINMEISKEMNLECDVLLKDIECRVLNGRKLNVKATITMNTSININKEIEFVNEIQGIQEVKLLNKQVSINSQTSNNQTKIFAKDTISLSNQDNLAEILGVEVRLINKEKKNSYNKILTKADACVKIMYLTEDNKIRCVQGNIPVVGFIDAENISEDNICNIKYEIRNIVVKPNSLEKSIFVEIEFEVNAKIYENKRFDMIQDLYSPTIDLKVENEEIETECIKENFTSICNFQEKQSITEVSQKGIYQVEVIPTIINQKVFKDKVMYEGEVCLNVLYDSDITKSLNTKKIIIPFTNEISKEGINSTSQLNTDIEIVKQNCEIKDGMLDIDLDMAFNVEVIENVRLNIINNVEVEENRIQKISSIIIYFVKPGDTLWSIAKMFRSTVEDIAEINDIKDVNKIDVGMQLFIPRYVKKASGE